VRADLLVFLSFMQLLLDRQGSGPHAAQQVQTIFQDYRIVTTGDTRPKW